MMHSMSSKRDPSTLFHLAYFSPCKWQRSLLFYGDRGRYGEHLTNCLQKSFKLCNCLSITQTSIDCSDQQVSLLRLIQVIGTSFNCHLLHLCATYKAFGFLPPEVITFLYIAWDKKDSDRNLQLTCER